MGRRGRRRAREAPGQAETAGTSDYTDAEGNVLTLRDSLSDGTVGKLEQLEARPAASAEDRWHRRVELLFEHLAVRWEIAGLPLEGPKEILGRYRLASPDERRQVREAIAEHVRKVRPDVEV